MAVNHKPEGYHTLTPFMLVRNAKGLIEYLKKAFDGKEKSLHTTPEGNVMHAEIKIGDSIVMLGEASDKWPANNCMLYLYVEDVDAVYKKAIAAGGESLREPTDEFYGDRSSGVKDPFGNQWWIATHIEDISPEEMKKREEAYASKN